MTYEILLGFFSQEISSGNAAPSSLVVHPFSAPEQVPPRFGLIDDSPDRWARLKARIQELNTPSENVKLLLLVRHGEGYHNAAEAKYGTQLWDDYWSKLNGDDELTWGPDPLLTSTGISQATYTHSIWETEVRNGALEPPSKIYCSPHSRALKTCELVFPPSLHPLVLIIEDCREENGLHTCDKRRPRTFISQTYPHFQIDASLTEEDILWDPLVRETKLQVAARAQSVVDRIWSDHPQDENFIAITAHSGFINGVLLALGHKPYPLPTGGVLPLIIRRRTSPSE